jgi:branched-chain amino acid transport system ATP-binding protein
MAGLRAQDVHIYLGDSYVIQGASLEIADGRAVAVLGRNGVGKTTLLRAIMGLTDVPRTGSLWWDSTELTHAAPWSRAAMGIGYVPQGRRIFPSLSVEENLRIGIRPARPGLDPWTIEELFALFPNLKERRRQHGTSLSGGEQQMLAIARALISNPRLILLDEPTEGLAPIMVQRILDVLQTVRRKGVALLLVEQNFRFAAALTDELLVMQAGRFVYSGTGLALADVAKVAERYLGVSTGAGA